MASKPIVVVTGATGRQGGGVVTALLADGRWAVRAVTRNPDAEKAQALAQRGVEVVAGDQGDVQSLVKAFAGAQAAFAVTDFMGGAQMNADKEILFGKNMIEAAKQVGIKHFVWSGLEDVREVPNIRDQLSEVEPGRLVSHFESKGEVTELLKQSGLPHTTLHTSIFYQAWSEILPFVPQRDGTHAFYLNAGDKAHVAHDADDIGGTTAVVLSDPETYLNKTVPVVGEQVRFHDVAAAISAVTGKTLKYVPVSDEQAANAGHPAAEELAAMWKYFRVFDNFNDLRPLSARAYAGKSFLQWAQDNKEGLAAHFQ